jgi:hypothetical protein
LYGFVGNSPAASRDVDGLNRDCCCVDSVSIDPESVTIKKPVRSTKPEEMIINIFEGHQFTVNIELSYKIKPLNAKDCACKFEWWEWSNVPLGDENKTKEKFVDVSKDKFGMASTTLKPWFENLEGTRKRTYDLDLTDRPSRRPLTKFIGTTRLLYIMVRVSSGPDCNCDKKSEAAYFYQKLSFVKGKAGPEMDKGNSEAKVVTPPLWQGRSRRVARVT